MFSPRYSLAILFGSLLAACVVPPSAPPPSARPSAAVVPVGTIASSEILEASGLARSARVADRLWVLNDGGSPPVLHAIGTDGAPQGTVRVVGAENRDWEDLATFEVGGAAYLMIADIGDNAARHSNVSLHIVPEPDPDTQAEVSVERSIDFVYPNGPQDAEAIAVDATGGNVYVLSKRTIPAKLYALPLSASQLVTAAEVGTLDTLPAPSAEDIRLAPRRLDWHWQPTAMDFSADGSFAAILTYRAVYRFERDDGESWRSAFADAPTVTPLGPIRDAEALCIVDNTVYVTVEGASPTLFRTAR